MKETFYFTHDYNAQNDPKIENMMFDKGWAGYGIFWALIEKLAQEPTHKMHTHYDRIAFALRTDTEMVKNIIENYQLFSVDDGMFWSNRLITHFKEREEKSQKAKLSAHAKWAQEASKNANASKTHMRSVCETDAIKERKGKEMKENNITEKVVKEKNTYFEAFVNLCALRKIQYDISEERYLQLRDEYYIRINFWERVQECVNWCYDKKKKIVNAQRLRNWLKNSIKFQKEKEIKIIQTFQDQKDIPKKVLSANQIPVWQPPS